MGGQRTMSGLIEELTGVNFSSCRACTLYWKKINKFPCFSVVSVVISMEQVAVYCGTLIWNPAGWNTTRTIVYYSRIETDIGIHTLPVTKLKIFSLLLVNFLHEYKLSSLVMTRHMDYWRSYKIKISHLSTYSRNHNIWRHRTNLMCTIIYFYCWQ